MEVMCTVNKKTIKSKEIDVSLTIEELDDLIEFLISTKESFIDRKKDSSIKKVVSKNGVFGSEDITKYSEIVKLGNKTMDYHSHQKDHNANTLVDFIIHTTFEAEKNEDDTFVWVNKKID